MRLLRMLKDGKLKAQDNGQVLPCGYWTDCVPIVGDLRAPIVGDLSAASPSLRLPREDVLRIFPETLTRPCSYVRARRQARIDRVIQRMRATRQWISCAEIADWSARNIPRPVDRQSRRSSTFNRLESTFAAGGFRLGGKSQLCFLSPDTSVVRLSFEPVDRTVDADGFRSASVSVPRFLELCWLPNEMCRAWFKQQKLDWPLHFETALREANETPKTKQQPEVEAEKRVGRPALIPNDVDEFERVLAEGSLSHRLKQEAGKLEAWGRKTLDEKKRLSAGRLENYIRDRLKSWDGKVPWKTK
jgi:hypothetical protein